MLVMNFLMNGKNILGRSLTLELNHLGLIRIIIEAAISIMLFNGWLGGYCNLCDQSKLK